VKSAFYGNNAIISRVWRVIPCTTPIPERREATQASPNRIAMDPSLTLTQRRAPRITKAGLTRDVQQGGWNIIATVAYMRTGIDYRVDM